MPGQPEDCARLSGARNGAGARAGVQRAERWAALGAGLLALAVLLTYQAGRDQGIYMAVADGMARGEAPYRDLWDFKPPLIYAIYWVARGLATLGAGHWPDGTLDLGGSTGPFILAVRALEAVTYASLLGAYALLAQPAGAGASAQGGGGGGERGRWLDCTGWLHWPRQPGLAAGWMVAVVMAVGMDYWHTGQPENFGGVAAVWALALGRAALHGSARRRWGFGAGAGLAVAAAFFCKPSAAGAGAGLLVLWGAAAIGWAKNGQRGQMMQGGFAGRERWRAPVLAAVAAGGATLLVAAVLGWLAAGAMGAARELFFEWVPNYTRLGTGSQPVPFGAGWARAVSSFMLGALPMAVLATWLCAAAVAGARAGRGARAEGWALELACGASLLVGLAGVAAQGKFFAYHYQAVVPLAGAATMLAVVRLQTVQRLWWAGAAVVAGVLAPLVWAHSSSPGARAGWALRWQAASGQISWREAAERWVDRQRRPDANPRENHRAAEALRLLVPVGGGRDAAVFVWGFEPIIYVEAGRRPASRYLYNVPQRARWGATEARAQLLADLRAKPPAAMVLQRRDRMTPVVGNNRDSAEEVATFPGLERLLATSYTLQLDTGNLQVLGLRRE